MALLGEQYEQTIAEMLQKQSVSTSLPRPQCLISISFLSGSGSGILAGKRWIQLFYKFFYIYIHLISIYINLFDYKYKFICINLDFFEILQTTPDTTSKVMI